MAKYDTVHMETLAKYTIIKDGSHYGILAIRPHGFGEMKAKFYRDKFYETGKPDLVCEVKRDGSDPIEKLRLMVLQKLSESDS